MNILVLNWRDIKHPRAGGAEVRLHKVYEPIAKNGNSVTLIATRFEKSLEQENINGLNVVRVGGDATFSILCMLNLKKWINKYKIDIVVEDFNKLPLFTPLFTKKKRVLQMHHLWMNSIFNEASFPVALFIWLSEQTLRLIYRKEKAIVVSNSTKEELHSMGLPKDNIEIIYNGVDLDFYKPKPNIIRENRLLWLSRIQKYKGIIECCEAFKKISDRYPNLKLSIAGNGPYKEQVINWIEKNNLSDRIELLGFVSEEQKRELMQSSFALIQSSYKEGWGLTVIESNSCGTPVIANNAPGLRDSVQHMKTGLLYEDGKAENLADSIIKLIDDTKLYTKLCENCRPWAEKFTWKKASKETFELLTKSLEI